MRRKLSEFSECYLDNIPLFEENAALIQISAVCHLRHSRYSAIKTTSLWVCKHHPRMGTFTTRHQVGKGRPHRNCLLCQYKPALALLYLSPGAFQEQLLQKAHISVSQLAPSMSSVLGGAAGWVLHFTCHASKEVSWALGARKESLGFLWLPAACPGNVRGPNSLLLSL